MRAALFAATALWPIAAFGQQTDQGAAQTIMSSQASQVPGGECAASSPCQSQGLVPITFQQGDVVLQGSITDAQGNTWALQPDSCNGNSPGNWWSGVYLNGRQVACGYTVALRNVGGVVWEEEAKGSGWQPVTNMTLGEGMVGPYVANPGQGTGGGQTASAAVAAASDPASTDPSSSSGQNCPGITLPGAVTPNSGTFMANGNTYSIDGNNGDVASVNGAPLNQWSYQTSQLALGSDGQVYGQSNAPDNNGTWFVLSADGSSWGEPLSGVPAAIMPTGPGGSMLSGTNNSDTTGTSQQACEPPPTQAAQTCVAPGTSPDGAMLSAAVTALQVDAPSMQAPLSADQIAGADAQLAQGQPICSTSTGQ